jgi:hypothetical protein
MKLFRNKKGYEMWMVVTAIASLALLVVLLIVYSGAFKGNTDSICKLSALANAGVRIPGTGMESYKLDCESDILTITMKDLEQGMKQAEIKMETFNTKFPDQKYTTLTPKDLQDQKEWVMDKIIAKEMRRWWGNMGSGNLNLFSNWYSFFGCTEEAQEDCKGLDKVKLWKWELNGPPKFCVIGTRIKFDEEIKGEFTDEIISLTEWTKNNPIPYTDESYYEFLLDDIVKGQGLFMKDYTYSTKEPYVVVYTKINKHMLNIYSSKVVSAGGALTDFITGWDPDLSWDTDSFNAMHLIPLIKLNETCTIVVN